MGFWSPNICPFGFLFSAGPMPDCISLPRDLYGSRVPTRLILLFGLIVSVVFSLSESQALESCSSLFPHLVV